MLGAIIICERWMAEVEQRQLPSLKGVEARESKIARMRQVPVWLALLVAVACEEKLKPPSRRDRRRRSLAAVRAPQKGSRHRRPPPLFYWQNILGGERVHYPVRSRAAIDQHCSALTRSDQLLLLSSA